MANKENPSGIQRPFNMDQTSSFFEVDGGFRGRVSSNTSDVTCAMVRSEKGQAMLDAGALMAALEEAEKVTPVSSSPISADRSVQFMVFEIGGKWYTTFRVMKTGVPLINWSRLELSATSGDRSNPKQSAMGAIELQLKLLR